MRLIALMLFFSVFIIANSSRADVRILEHVRHDPGGLELPDPIGALLPQPAVGFRPFMMPADGRVSSTYGWRRDPVTMARRFHAGIDLANIKGSTVHAAAEGLVLYAGWGSGCGLEVVIGHGLGVLTRYCHLAETHAKPGESVEAGEAIGAVGSSGRATGPHLHFELMRMGAAIDPAPYLSLWSDHDGGAPEDDNSMKVSLLK